MDRCHFRRVRMLAVALAAGAVVEAAPDARAAGSAAAWQTCYFGVQAGVSSSQSRWDFTTTNPYSATGNAGPILVPGADFSATRGVVGGQIGCNHAIFDTLLVGVEGSWFSNPMNQHKNTGFFPDPAFVPRTTEVLTTNIQSVFAFTGKLGVALSPDWLVYAKGGYAGARIETSGTVSPVVDPAIFDFKTSAFHSGWTAGVGLEYRLFRNVTIGAEYNYYNFANVSRSGAIAAVDIVGGVATPSNPVGHRLDADAHAVMARINYGFDPFRTSPPTAAYAQAGEPAGRFSSFITTEAKYASWSGSRGANVFLPTRGAGYQVYSPTTIGIDYVQDAYKLETRIKGGYVYSAQRTFGQSAHYEGPIDTQASFNLTLLNFDSIRPLLGLSMNLPTGNTYLPGNQRFTRMDADLVDVGSYGTGFNLNPTAGFIIGLTENIAASLSAGYTWQGNFTKEGINLAEIPNPAPPPINISVSTLDLRQTVRPGATHTLNANISGSFTNLVLITSAAYVGSSEASIDNKPSGRAGARFTANGTATYNFDQRTALTTNVSWSFAEKNEIPNGLGGLVVEPKNSNSNVYTGSVEPSYLLTERLKLATNYSFLYRDHNYYDPIQEQFIPAKHKYQVGASATYAVGNAASIVVRGSHSWIKQEDGPYLLSNVGPPAVVGPQPPALSYQAWATSVAANVRF